MKANYNGCTLWAQAMHRRTAPGFTLIELLVVLAIVAVLLTVAVPRYFRSVDHSREVALRQSLAVMRDAIDKFRGDQGIYPESLDMLVEKKYLRNVPVDPVTGTASSWIIVPPKEQDTGKVYNVRSGAQGQSSDGTSYEDW